MTRSYELKKRAERMAATEHRIVDAAVGLHTSVGPGHTSIAAVAERAGVQRHTVYAHFPDRLSLFKACSAHWRMQHPFPELDGLAALQEPSERLRATLDVLYAWYEEVEHDLALFIRDAELVPAEVREADGRLHLAVREMVEKGWPRRGMARAAIGHALAFETWRSLCRRERLSRRVAVGAMVRLVSGA
jgi:AcrR family transcriptional regulator